MALSKGKYAKAISDRSGMEFPYNEMIKEWNGSFVHISEYEEKHPQLELRANRGAEQQGLRNARPQRIENEVLILLKPDAFETISSSSGIINVSEQGHGRSTGDTVRFRGARHTTSDPDGFKNPKYAPCPLLVNMVMAGKLGVKSDEGFYDYSQSRKAEKISKQFK